MLHVREDVALGDEHEGKERMRRSGGRHKEAHNWASDSITISVNADVRDRTTLWESDSATKQCRFFAQGSLVWAA